MEIRYGLTGGDRKRLVATIGELLETAPVYKGTPSFAYEIDVFTVDRNGTLIFSDRTDSETVETLLDGLLQKGFEAESTEEINDVKASLVIELPLNGVTDTALENLRGLIRSKDMLIKKAIGADSLEIELTEETIRFPWFSRELTTEEIGAYAHFIDKLLGTAKSLKRAGGTERPAENEKYTFRCFLLRLGFIGDAYKKERRVLLSRLEGSSAYKSEKTEEHGDE